MTNSNIITTASSGSINPPKIDNSLFIHIDSTDEDKLPMKVALEHDIPVAIYGSEDRVKEIKEITAEFRDDFINASGIVHKSQDISANEAYCRYYETSY